MEAAWCTACDAYAVYVDEQDKVWLTDFGANAIVRFDPATERFASVPRGGDANVRHLAGMTQNVWGGESSGNDRLVRIEFAPVS